MTRPVVLFVFACTLIMAKGVVLNIDVTCGPDNCTEAFYIYGVANPNIHCDLGDTIRFSVRTPETPFYIKTKQSLGAADTWSQVENNGITYGNLEFACTIEAKISPIFYQSGLSVKAGATICVEKPCGATLCTHNVCWGDLVEDKTPNGIVKYISALAEEFAWHFEKFETVESWTWQSKWREDTRATVKAVAFFAKIEYLRSGSSDSVITSVRNELAAITGVPATWFDIVVTEEGGLTDITSAELYVHDPDGIDKPPIGGFVDMLFFGGITENLREEIVCRIHTNLIGEYSGNNHVEEGKCVPNIDPNWGYSRVEINEARNGGYYALQCDDQCRFCKQEGSFDGDECICYVDDANPQPTGFPYYCISLKYASAFRFAPSLFVLLVLLARLL